MKKNRFIHLAMASVASATLLTACQEEQETEQTLKLKRSELKAELAEINGKLSAFETVVNLPLVVTSKVKQDRFTHFFEVYGDVRSEKTINISPEMAGVITKVYVKQGDYLRKGQLIATINDDILNNQINELDKQLILVESLYRKQERLYKDSTTSEIAYLEAKTNFESLTEKKETLLTQKGKYQVRAPFSGAIDLVFAHEGEMGSPQGALARLVNTNEVQVVAEVSESYLNELTDEQIVDIIVPATGDTLLDRQVSRKGKYINPKNRTFEIEVNVKNNKTLIPNLMALVRVKDIDEPKANMVPERVVQVDSRGKSYVYVIETNSKGQKIVKKKFITIGGASKSYSWVKSGLQGSEEVIVEGFRKVAEGDEVKTNS